MAEGTEADDEARLLRALAPDDDERAMLACIGDEGLRDELLFKLLRAPVGALVRVEVNERMSESDSFSGISLSDLLVEGVYTMATLCRSASGGETSFDLACAACPPLNRTYVGDSILDHLLQYFAKGLIRFPRVQVCRLSLELWRSSSSLFRSALMLGERGRVAFVSVPILRSQEDVNEPAHEPVMDEGGGDTSALEESVEVTEGADDSQEVLANNAPEVTECESMQGERTESESMRVQETDTIIRVGDRLIIARDDASLFTTASVMTVKAANDGSNLVIVVYDDMMWAAFHYDHAEKGLIEGRIRRVSETEDVSPNERAHVFVSPYSGAPPDCFLFDEHILPEGANGWRWFRRLQPAPPNGTFGQRFSPARMQSPLIAGAIVKLCGRATKLMPGKRADAKELLTTETEFYVLGLVQAELPMQKSYWAVVMSPPHDGHEGQTYVCSIFGKSGNAHMTTVAQESIGDDGATVMAWSTAAMVSAHVPCVLCPYA